MTKLFFLCGFIGSGKTTYAKQLAKSHPAFRFSIDEWMIPLYGEHMSREDFDHRLHSLTELFKSSALQMVELDTSVIFDLGFWNRKERESIIQWATSQGIDYEMIYLKCPFEVCQQRAFARNATRTDKAYEMTSEMLAMFWQWFEVPTEQEGITLVDSNDYAGT
jgi:predicted kinase